MTRERIVPPDPNCPTCGGAGVVDSGGVTPWGTPIDQTCPCMIEHVEDLQRSMDDLMTPVPEKDPFVRIEEIQPVTKDGLLSIGPPEFVTIRAATDEEQRAALEKAVTDWERTRGGLTLVSSPSDTSSMPSPGAREDPATNHIHVWRRTDDGLRCTRLGCGATRPRPSLEPSDPTAVDHAVNRMDPANELRSQIVARLNALKDKAANDGDVDSGSVVRAALVTAFEYAIKIVDEELEAMGGDDG